MKLYGPLAAPPTLPTLIALRGIIAVYRDPDALAGDPTVIILEGGAKICVSPQEGTFVRHEWENWAHHEATRRAP